ncbi:NAD(P)H-binding protein, partial [Nocardioides sp. NPDC000441]
MTIAITGASGQLGRLVADQLLTTVDPAELVLLTRDPAKLADYAERGADVRAADFSKPDELVEAFAGVERVLLISTDAVGARVEGHLAAIDAAVKAGVRHMAYTSVSGPTADNPAGVVADHAATEEALRESGLAWTMLRNN